MSVNAVKDGIPDTGSQSYSATRAALAALSALPLINAAAVTAFNAEDNAAEYTTYNAVLYAGQVYEYDSSDSTSSHDPAGGVIVDGSARRYIRATGLQPVHVVLDKDLTAPPGGETFADTYYVAASATGDWAGHDGEIAYYSDRGWLFDPVDEGFILYVTDEACFYYMPSGGTLTKGLGDLALGDASIEAKHLAFPMGISVEASQATPPGSPTDRVCYIVTATATGAWAGEETKVAEYDSTAAAWVFHTPVEGAFVYAKDDETFKKFNGTAWVDAIADSGIVEQQVLDIAAYEYGTFTENAEQVFKTFSVTGLAGDTLVLDFQYLLLEIKIAVNGRGFNSGYFYIQKDSEVTKLLQIDLGAADPATSYLVYLDLWARGIVDEIEDGSAHDYKLGFKFSHSGSEGPQLRATIKGALRHLRTTRVTS